MNFDFADKNDSKDVPENEIPEEFGNTENPTDAEASQQNNFSEVDSFSSEPDSADTPDFSAAANEEQPMVESNYDDLIPPLNQDDDFLENAIPLVPEDTSDDFDDAFGEVEENVEGGAVIGSPELKNFNFEEDSEEEVIPPIEETDESQTNDDSQEWLSGSDSTHDEAVDEPDSIEENLTEETSEDSFQPIDDESDSEDTSEDQSSEDQSEQSFGFGEAPQAEQEEIKALDKKVRTPDGEQEYLLSELIDVETGLPLDLAALIPAELISDEEQGAGGFDMTSGGGEEGTSKRKRRPAPKPKAAKGGIGGIILGGILAVIIFPYVMGVIEMTTGKTSNIPIPAPGIKCTYKYIPKWWPEWAMFVFPGRDATTTDKSADPTKPVSEPENKEGENPQENVPEAVDADQLQQEGGENLPGETVDEDLVEVGSESETPEDSAMDSALDAAIGITDSTESMPEETPAESLKPGLVSTPSYTSADVSVAIEAVGKAIGAEKKIGDATYTALSDMAEKSTFVDTTKVDDQLKDCMTKVKNAMNKFGAKPAFATVLSDKMEARSADADDQAGVLVVGTLSDVSERDGYKIGLMDVEGKPGLTVEIVGTRSIKPAIGTKIVVCGKRIANPDTNLAGFSDNGIPVIWGGIIIPVKSK